MRFAHVAGILSLFGLLMPSLGLWAAEPAPSFTNTIGMEFVLIPAGAFQMGDEQGVAHALPVHTVTFRAPFYLGKYEVTQGQWEAIMGSNPSRFKGADHPVEYVTWHDVQAFIRRLNDKEPHASYRLPTEAEWEYAARAGTPTLWHWGNNPNLIAHYAWFDENAAGRTHPVGTLKPNPWGVYDMLGNVLEWTQDAYDDAFYYFSPESDPVATEGENRVHRGGSWQICSANIRPGWRGNDSPEDRGRGIGFRLALTPPAQ